MTAREYKDFKGLRKESLRDNMSDIELALTDLSEVATKELTNKFKPYGLEENKYVSNKGGKVANTAKQVLEEELGETIITNKNNLNYEYIDENNYIESK